jgi:hypothetical protein
MEKGFRRIATTLIIISLVTAVLIGVYLWYAFNARSTLPLIVPKNVLWYYHFQTKEIRKEVKVTPPPYFDSLINTIKKMPVFVGVKDPAEPGLAIYSDVILFETNKGWFAALSVKSEQKLLEFCRNLNASGMTGEVKDAGTFHYLKAKNRNIYFAFKHKAALFFIPSDTVSTGYPAGETLTPFFAENSNHILKNETIQELYDQDCQVVYYSSSPDFGLTHGVQLSESKAEFVYKGKKQGSADPSPLMLYVRAGLKYEVDELNKLISKENKMATREYLNQAFITANRFLKPFQK